MKLTLSELSRIYDMPVSTLRYYIKEGILPNTERRDNQQIILDIADITTLNLILILKNAGCSMQMMAEFMTEYEKIKDSEINSLLVFRNCRKMISDQTSDLLRQMKTINEQLQVANYLRWMLDTFEEKGHCFISDEMEQYNGPLPEDFLEKCREVDSIFTFEEVAPRWEKKYMGSANKHMDFTEK